MLAPAAGPPTTAPRIATMPDTDTPTVADLDLADEQLDREARVAAVAEWNGLPPTRQAHALFDAILAKRRRRVARSREKQAARGGP